jgi:hypothetical protein
MNRFIAALLVVGVTVVGLGTAADDEPEPTKPANLDQLNSDKDEDDPHVISSSTGLFYTVKNKDKIDLLVTQRRKGSPWTRGQLWPQFEEKADFRSVFMTRDNSFPQKLYFATNKDPEKNAPGDNYDIYYLMRQGPTSDYTFRTAEIGVCTAADEMHPWITVDGLQMYFSRKDREGWHVYVASRPKGGGRFLNPVRVNLPDNFYHATVSPNGLTMYVQGPLPNNRWGLFKCIRTAAGGWSKPEPLDSLNNSQALRGDLSPNLTRDGLYLYFASDRPGGKGGLDIWTVPTAALVKKP